MSWIRFYHFPVGLFPIRPDDQIKLSHNSDTIQASTILKQYRNEWTLPIRYNSYNIPTFYHLFPINTENMECAPSIKTTNQFFDAETSTTDADSRRLGMPVYRNMKPLSGIPQSLFEGLPAARKHKRPIHEILSTAITVLKDSNRNFGTGVKNANSNGDKRYRHDSERTGCDDHQRKQ